MRVLVIAAILALALPAAASAKANPLRTETQATNYVLKHIDSGTAICYGRGKSTTDLYRSFACATKDFDTGRAESFYLSTRPNGKWIRT